MSRKLTIVALVVLLVLAIAVPAFAAFALRESESAFCDHTDHVWSRVHAVDDHQHRFTSTRVNFGPIAWWSSYENWSPQHEGTVRLYNTSGHAYSYSSSYAYCS